MRKIILLFFLTWSISSIAQDQALNRDIFNSINEFRLKNGRSPLVYDSAKQKDADRWSKKMINKGLEHDQKCDCWENIAQGWEDTDFVQVWINSMRHRMNLLNNRGSKAVVSISRYKDTRLMYAVFRIYK